VTLPLHSERLVVREIKTADLDELPAICADPKALLWEPAFTREQRRAMLEQPLSRYREDRIAEIVPDNEGSRGVARRLGMTVERQVVWADRPHDLWALDLP
jgi:RimJ/RimL family protein N-acetyltransferase